MPNNKKNGIKIGPKTHYKIDSKKSKMVIRGGRVGNEHVPLFYQHFIFLSTVNLPFPQSTSAILPYNIQFLQIFTKK